MADDHGAPASVLANHPDIDLALDGITVLIDHSLLRREDAPGGETRYRMLETIREYAEEELVAAG